jgi:hypothetical protein
MRPGGSHAVRQQLQYLKQKQYLKQLQYLKQKRAGQPAGRVGVRHADKATSSAREWQWRFSTPGQNASHVPSVPVSPGVRPAASHAHAIQALRFHFS